MINLEGMEIIVRQSKREEVREESTVPGIPEEDRLICAYCSKDIITAPNAFGGPYCETPKGAVCLSHFEEYEKLTAFQAASNLEENSKVG